MKKYLIYGVGLMATLYLVYFSLVALLFFANHQLSNRRLVTYPDGAIKLIKYGPMDHLFNDFTFLLAIVVVSQVICVIVCSFIASRLSRRRRKDNQHER